MKFKTFSFLAVVLLLNASCSENHGNSAADLPIAIHSTIQTRATETAFEEGDKIGITIKVEGSESNPYQSNAELTHNGTYFISSDIKWYSDDKEAIFEAYHPFRTNHSKNFSVLEDQSSGGYYESDLLLAYADNVKPNVNGVALSFVHSMSQLLVLLDNYSDYEITAVRIKNTKGDVAINADSKTVAVRLTALPIEINAYKLNETVFRAILAPQEVAIEIEIENEINKTVSKTFKTISMVGGESYKASITITNDFDISDYEITSEGDIDGWEDGGLLPEN